MYHHPSSSSSSQQNPMGPTGGGGSGGLTRFVSAPGSLLRTAVDSIIGSSSSQPQPSIVSSSHSHHHHHYFTGGSTTTAGGDSSSSSSFTTTESTCKVNSSNAPNNNTNSGLQRSYGFDEIPQTLAASSSSSSSSSLLRQRSSPAGFLSHFASENGFSVTRETGNYNSQGRSSGGLGVSRLKSQLSFTRQDSLSQISEESENGIDGVSSGSGRQNATHSYSTASFGMDSWENGTSIVFSAPSKRTKTLDADIFNCLNALDSQFSMPQTSLEMATVENLLNIPEDSVPCKIRAKRGCATHPRSIAERERRTRISGKLKKLQDLVPNMDKQTSYADMLDLAVQHIKGLQNQVENLHNDLEHCTCGCKPTS